MARKRIDIEFTFQRASEFPIELGKGDSQRGRAEIYLTRFPDADDDLYIEIYSKVMIHEVLHILIDPEVKELMQRDFRIYRLHPVVEAIAQWSKYGRVNMKIMLDTVFCGKPPSPLILKVDEWFFKELVRFLNSP